MRCCPKCGAGIYNPSDRSFSMMKNTMLEMSRYAALARQAVAEGIVLLKNEAVLPLASGGRAALFGYAQFHYYQSGTGSGGLVNTAHVPKGRRRCALAAGGSNLRVQQQRCGVRLREHDTELRGTRLRSEISPVGAPTSCAFARALPGYLRYREPVQSSEDGCLFVKLGVCPCAR